MILKPTLLTNHYSSMGNSHIYYFSNYTRIGKDSITNRHWWKCVGCCIYNTFPFSIMSLMFGPASGFIISKIGSSRVIFAGRLMTTSGFISILISHYDAIQIAINLAIIGSGLSLLNVGQININAASTSNEFMGISYGINTLFRFIGSAIGPAFAGMFMQANQTIASTYYENNIISLPSATSFVIIFFCMFILAAVTIYLSIIAKK